jgi:hypothetical protein
LFISVELIATAVPRATSANPGGFEPSGVRQPHGRGSHSHCSPALAGPARERYGRGVSDEDIKAELERLRAENERLKQSSARASSIKVSEKGGVSVYGLGRFPVTLYKEQWTKLLDMADDIRAFITENESKLKSKPEK